ncbi:MAG: cytochrome c oxidase subunit 2 [Patiriisocius sp.]|jgi:cytochrome c oxidase subunit 2
MNFLIALVLVLAVAAISQILKVYRLSSNLSDTREEEIDEKSNDRVGTGMLLFGIFLVVFLFWLIYAYSDEFLPQAATLHGVEIDWLMKYNLYLVTAVYAVFNLILFYFTNKYKYKKGVKAFYYSHSNKLEVIWTVVPSIVMAVVVIAGIFIWNKINDDPSPDAIAVQLYAKQFDWTARYSGADNKLGPSSFNFISSTNPLGVITDNTRSSQLKDTEELIANMKDDLKNKIMSETASEEMRGKLGRLERLRVRILGFDSTSEDYLSANDDVIVKEMYFPVNKEVNFHINSRDVLHSVFIPHFRLQMNAVPGMTTNFKFTPIITSKQMQEDLNDPDFKYVLMCNKICGASHYNMRMEIKVVSEDEYEDWLASNKDFVTKQKELTASAE